MTSKVGSFSELNQPRYAPELEEEGGFDLRRILGALIRYKWALLVLCFGATAMAWVTSSTQTPIYRATATLLLEGDQANLVSIESVYDTTGMRSREYINTQIRIMRSRSLVEATVDRLGLHQDPRMHAALSQPALLDRLPFVGGEPERINPNDPNLRDRVIGWVRAHLSVNAQGGTTLVNISVEAPDRSLAADIANAHGESYIDSGLEARLEMTQRAADWLTVRLDDLRDNLQRSERALQTFREENNLVDVTSSDGDGGIVSLASSRLESLNRRLLEQQQERISAENALALIADAPQERWSSVSAVTENPALNELLRTRTSIEGRIAELSGRYGPRHPRMVSAQVELEQVREAINRRAEDVVASLRSQIQRAQANERDLREQIASTESDVQNIQRQSYRLRELQREAQANRRLYDMFLERFKETRQTDFQEATARFLEPALGAGQISPNPRRDATFAFFLALALGFGAVFLREQLNNTIRAIDDVEAKLRLPLLGSVPKLDLKREELNKARTLYVQSDKGPFSEAIRSIRTGVVLSGLDTPHKVVCVTSSIPGEGKTTVATNLAFAFAQLERTILLDADMRRPDLAREFNLNVKHGGISNVISGNAKLEDAISQTEWGLDVLPAGIIPPNPLELLSSKRFTAMLEALKKRYDRIIIDTAPVNAASDALILSTLSDALVFVAKFESTPLPVVQKSISSLRQVNAPIIGAVVNSIDMNRPDRYGYYGYYYNYAGYYQEDEASDKKAG